ncbi:MAG: MarR family winged helix-turn-helix transcriptional regulator [Pararhodobacter sp.]
MEAPATQARSPAQETEEVRLGRLGQSLGFLLRLAQLQVFESFYENPALSALKPGEMTLLWVVGLNPGIRQGLMAERLRIKRSAATLLVRDLEARNLLARTIPKDDRRSVALALTAEGRRYLAQHAEAFFAQDAVPQPRLNEPECRQLVTLLQRLTGVSAQGDD